VATDISEGRHVLDVQPVNAEDVRENSIHKIVTDIAYKAEHDTITFIRRESLKYGQLLLSENLVLIILKYCII
jgi:hypothetical protein